MMMTRRIATLAVVLGILAVVALGWFLGVAPLFSQATAASQELDAVNAENQLQQARLETMREQFNNLPELLEELQEAEQSIPRDPDLDAFIAQLGQLADRPEIADALVEDGVTLEQVYAGTSGVTVSSISFLEPVLYGGVPAAAPVATEGDDGVTEQPAIPVTDGSALPPELASISYTVPVSFTLSGPFDSTMLFLLTSQFGDRLLVVTDVSIVGVGGEQVTMTVSGHLLVLRDPRTADIVFPEPDPTPTPTPAPTPTQTPTPTPTSTTGP